MSKFKCCGCKSDGFCILETQYIASVCTKCPYGFNKSARWEEYEELITPEKPPVYYMLPRPTESSSPSGEINPEEIACILRKAFGNEVNAKVTIRIEK